MTPEERIRLRMDAAATATIGDIVDKEDSPWQHPVAAALLTSRLVQAVVGDAPDAVRRVPVPDIPRPVEMQLAILWRRYRAAPAERRGIRGAFDRIVADLYGLSVDDLMSFEMAAPPAEHEGCISCT